MKWTSHLAQRWTKIPGAQQLRSICFTSFFTAFILPKKQRCNKINLMINSREKNDYRVLLMFSTRGVLQL